METFTLDGVEYTAAQFSQEVQQSLMLIKRVQNDKVEAEIEMIKCQATLEKLNAAVSDKVRGELEARKNPPEKVVAEAV